MSKQIDRLNKLVTGIKQGMTDEQAFKLISDKIEKLEGENKILDKKLFNLNEHYKLVSENYDLAFEFFAEKIGVVQIIAFGQFKKWIEAKLVNKENENESV